MALGDRPTDPIAAIDHDTATRALTHWRNVAPSAPEITQARSLAAARHIAAAESAADALHAAAIAERTATQQAEDLTNRAAAAEAAGHPGAAELAQRAAAARDVAQAAAVHHTAARQHAAEQRPQLLRSRTDAQRAAEQRRQRTQLRTPTPCGSGRPFRHLTELQLLTEHDQVRAQAALTGLQPDQNRPSDPAAGRLRRLAAQLREEAALRAVLPDVPPEPNDTRRARSPGADDRLRAAYTDEADAAHRPAPAPRRPAPRRPDGPEPPG
jgi:hypothetical protein